MEELTIFVSQYPACVFLHCHPALSCEIHALQTPLVVSITICATQLLVAGSMVAQWNDLPMDKSMCDPEADVKPFSFWMTFYPSDMHACVLLEHSAGWIGIISQRKDV